MQNTPKSDNSNEVHYLEYFTHSFVTQARASSLSLRVLNRQSDSRIDRKWTVPTLVRERLI